MLHNIAIKFKPSTLYNIVFGTRSYSTPSADWRFNPKTKVIEQWCKRDNMEHNIIVYRPNGNTWKTHIARVERQAKLLHG